MHLFGGFQRVKFVPPASHLWPVNYMAGMDLSVLPLNFWSTVSRNCTCDSLSSMVTDWLGLTNNFLFSLTSIFTRLFVWKALAELEEKCDHKIERIQLNPKTAMGSRTYRPVFFLVAQETIWLWFSGSVNNRNDHNKVIGVI